MYSRPQTEMVVKTIVVSKTRVAMSKVAGAGPNPAAGAKLKEV